MSDLIRREALIEKLEEYIEYDTFDLYKEEPLISLGFEQLEDIICSQPTVEAKEVLHGEWKNRAEYNDHLHCECSICGFTTENYRVIKTFGISSDDYIEVKWVYCPKCGASMQTSAE